MKPSVNFFKLDSFDINPQKGIFPLSPSGNYSPVTGLTKSQIFAWPANHFQMYMDYCLAKELYEVASLIRDIASLRRISLNMSA